MARATENNAQLRLVKGTTDEQVITHASQLNHADRMSLLKQLSGTAGLRLPDTILPEGTALWDVGERNKRKLQAEIAKLPTFMEAALSTLARIEVEDPQDFPLCDVNGFVMNPENGRIYGNEDDPSQAIGYTRAGFSHLIDFIKPVSVSSGAASTLLSLSPGVRAAAYNEWAGKAASDKMTIRTIVEPRSQVRIIRAVVSGRHSVELGDDKAILETLLNNDFATLKNGTKCRITREHDATQMEIIWPSMSFKLAVGDIALVGIRISNSEVRKGSLKVEVFLLRVLCANFTSAYTKDDNAEVVSIRHMGDLRTKLLDAFKNALNRVEPFVKLFADAYNVSFPGNQTRADLLLKVRRAYQLPEFVADRAAEVWDIDGLKSAGDTLAGLVNALTRASQDQVMEQATVTERAAGDLLHRKWSAVGLVG
jgi:hypothetical protein